MELYDLTKDIEVILKKFDNIVDKSKLNNLVEETTKALEHSYSPYSKLHVGCGLLASDGTIIRGANVENASFGLTVCAERCAIFTAINSGVRSFDIAAVTCNKNFLITPCGACRQVLCEFKVKYVLCFTPDNKCACYSLDYLLPAEIDLTCLKK